MADKPNDPVFFRERLWLGLKRWTWVKIAFVAMVFAFALLLWFVRRNYDEDTARAKRDAVTQCNDFNSNRQVLRDLLTEQYASGFNLPLTSLPSFAFLDQDTKNYFTELEGVLKNASSDEVRQQALTEKLTKLELRDCERDFGG